MRRAGAGAVACRGAWPLAAGLIGLLLLAPGQGVADTRLADTVEVTRPVNDDLYAAGGAIRIGSAVAGTALLAAGTVDISGDVEGDVLAAAGRVSINGGVGDDLRAAGGTIEVEGFVTDGATLAGGSVSLGPASAIGGRTWIAAGTAEVAGQIGGDLRIAAGTAVIAGRIAGDVEVAAREIRIEPGAIIGGNLVWRSADPPSIAEDARILGEVRAADAPEARPFADESSRGSGGGWALAIAVLAAALILLWVAPGLVARAASVFRAAPGRTLLLGAAAIVLTPVLTLLLFVTVLGWLLAMVVMAGYLFALLLSGLLGLLVVVHLVRARLEARAPAGQPARGGWRSLLLLVLLVVAVVGAQQVPVLGGLLSLFLVLAGFGALTALVTGRGPPKPP